jgi:hypothetical protein
MLETRVKQLKRLIPFVRKEAAEKEATKKEDDDVGPVSTIRFLRIKRWFKYPIYLNYLYEHKNGLVFHIESFIKDEMSPPDVVKQHLHLSRLLDMQP